MELLYHLERQQIETLVRDDVCGHCMQPFAYCFESFIYPDNRLQNYENNFKKKSTPIPEIRNSTDKFHTSTRGIAINGEN